jgi:ABC-type multidrug transport system permease subunit
MLIEKNEGMLERCLVSGITPTEILFSHLLTQFTVVVCQEFLLLIFSFVVFDLTNRGNLLWIVMLLTLTGICGMCYGFLISSYCDKERTACYIGLGSFNPTIMLCGIIWPIEGMHPILQAITVYMPLTKSIESLRSIMQRGWEIDRHKVYMGYISTTVWIVIFLSLSLIVLKFKKG